MAQSEIQKLMAENKKLQNRIKELESLVEDLQHQLNPPEYRKVLGFTIREYKIGAYKKWRAIKTVDGYQFRIHIPKASARNEQLIEETIIAWLDKYPDKKKLFIKKYPEYTTRIPGAVNILTSV